MQQGFKANHFADAEGNSAGGMTTGVGFAIAWQNGPLGRGNERLEPNGAFVEDVIAAAIDRIEWYQRSQFACSENADAIRSLNHALERLQDRTKNRESRGVEGTHRE